MLVLYTIPFICALYMDWAINYRYNQGYDNIKILTTFLILSYLNIIYSIAVIIYNNLSIEVIIPYIILLIVLSIIYYKTYKRIRGDREKDKS